MHGQKIVIPVKTFFLTTIKYLKIAPELWPGSLTD